MKNTEFYINQIHDELLDQQRYQTAQEIHDNLDKGYTFGNYFTALEPKVIDWINMVIQENSVS